MFVDIPQTFDLDISSLLAHMELRSGPTLPTGLLCSTCERDINYETHEDRIMEWQTHFDVSPNKP